MSAPGLANGADVTGPVPFARVAAVALATAVALAPSAGWIIAAWSGSPLDAWGWLFLVVAVAWTALVLDRVDVFPDGLDAAAWPLLAGAALLAAAGWLIDVRVIIAAAGLGLGWSTAWLLLGGAAGLLLLPALLLAGLALPTVGFLLAGAWSALGLPPLPGLTLKALVAVLVLGAGVVLLGLARRGRLPRPGPLQSAYLVALAAAAAGLLTAFNPPTFGPPLALAEEQWRFGSWYGAEIPVSPSEQRLFSDSRRLSKRLYARRDGARVSVLVVESGDVHELHAPEYCLTGSGWVLGTPAATAAAAGDGPGLPLTAAAAEITGERAGQALAGVYWFSSASLSTADLAGLRLRSRLAPGEPFTLYLVTAVESAAPAARRQLTAFLREAPWLGATPGDGGG